MLLFQHFIILIWQNEGKLYSSQKQQFEFLFYYTLCAILDKFLSFLGFSLLKDTNPGWSPLTVLRIKRNGLIDIVLWTIKCHINEGAYYSLSPGPVRPYDLFPGLFIYSWLIPAPTPTLPQPAFWGPQRWETGKDIKSHSFHVNIFSPTQSFFRPPIHMALNHKPWMKQHIPAPHWDSASLTASDLREDRPPWKNSSWLTYFSQGEIPLPA